MNQNLTPIPDPVLAESVLAHLPEPLRHASCVDGTYADADTGETYPVLIGPSGRCYVYLSGEVGFYVSENAVAPLAEAEVMR